MVSHVQTHNRQLDRAPGVLHRATPGIVPKFSARIRSERRQPFSRWRLISAVMFLLFIVILALFFQSDVFYVRSIQVLGNNFITREEVFAFSDIADFHMFWLDPAQIRENLLRSSSIADLSIEIGWPPNLITITVQERQPAIIWSEGGADTWIDLQGRVMRARAEMPDLLHINLLKADSEGPKPKPEDFTRDKVLGALRLKEILPADAHLDFHPAHGLGWTNNQGWQIWMGSDSAAVMSQKINIYEVLVENLNNRAMDVAELNIANPDAPFYRLIWGR